MSEKQKDEKVKRKLLEQKNEIIAWYKWKEKEYKQLVEYKDEEYRLLLEETDKKVKRLEDELTKWKEREQSLRNALKIKDGILQQYLKANHFQNDNRSHPVLSDPEHSRRIFSRRKMGLDLHPNRMSMVTLGDVFEYTYPRKRKGDASKNGDESNLATKKTFISGFEPDTVLPL
ncbi:hypothetical protein [Thermoflavimicrobium dichotomicum]|uniref:hypothetical protein n=1 Tax=Thermoflavimicrobium dichotomicum TaxID=46223 RepID=UPI00158786AF|nr:hypothetical protein [Thermoflavimicrobium dichotomicum]